MITVRHPDLGTTIDIAERMAGCFHVIAGG
jgi:hypothetical protein